MGQIFISYSSADETLALTLATDLKASGHTIWIAKWNVIGRLPFWVEIQDAIDKSAVFLFVVSPDSLNSNSSALLEAYYAVALRPRPTIVLVVARAVSRYPIILSPSMYQLHDLTKFPYNTVLQGILNAVHFALSAPTPARTSVKKDVFGSSDFPALAKLIQQSGRASSISREAFCIETLIEYDDLSASPNLNAYDFALTLVKYLYSTGNFEALLRLCDVIGKHFHGQMIADLNILRDKVNNTI